MIGQHSGGRKVGVKDPVRGCKQRERNRKRAEVEETDMRGDGP